MVHAPAARAAMLGGVLKAMLPLGATGFASAAAPHSSQTAASDSSPTALSCAFSRSLLGKVCKCSEADTFVAGCNGPGPAAATVAFLLRIRAAKFCRDECIRFRTFA